jgi:hypothetical protein
VDHSTNGTSLATQDGAASGHVALDVPNPVNLRIEAEPGGRTQTALVPADMEKLLSTVGAEAKELSKFLGSGVRVWPGGALSFVGVVQLGVAFVTEVVDPARLGVAEFLASTAVGTVLAVTGPLVITRNVSKSNDVVAATFNPDAWRQQFQERYLRKAPQTSRTEDE